MLRVALPERPLPSCTVAVSVCAPSATVVVSKLQLTLVAVPEGVQRTIVPSGGRRGSSTLRLQLSVPVVPGPAVADTVIVPPTVAPAAGLVNEETSCRPLATLTTRGVLPVWPAESRALAMTVVEPSTTFVVSHAIEIGPADVSLALPTTAPFTLSE